MTRVRARRSTSRPSILALKVNMHRVCWISKRKCCCFKSGVRLFYLFKLMTKKQHFSASLFVSPRFTSSRGCCPQCSHLHSCVSPEARYRYRCCYVLNLLIFLTLSFYFYFLHFVIVPPIQLWRSPALPDSGQQRLSRRSLSRNEQISRSPVQLHSRTRSETDLREQAHIVTKTVVV